MTLVCIRQPGYMPYLGFFKKIQSCDIFVYFDDTKYVDKGWDNRNQIKTDRGAMWLTVPVIRKSTELLKDVLIGNDQNWQKKHLKSIELNYRKAPFFQKYWNAIQSILNTRWNKLIDLNIALIEYFKMEVGITTKTILSSELQIDLPGSLKLLEICKKLNAKTYLSG
ncbi:MAG: WbqC family protein, partial [Candidatus Paceibacterota bacterium]